MLLHGKLPLEPVLLVHRLSLLIPHVPTLELVLDQLHGEGADLQTVTEVTGRGYADKLEDQGMKCRNFGS